MLLWSIEPWLQRWRIAKIQPYLPKNGVLVDIGCDDPPVLLNQVKGRMKRCIGIDIAIEPYREKNLELVKMDLQKKIALPSQLADTITMLAVLEHLQYPEAIISECFRILKHKGRLLMTVPSPRNEPLLEILADLHLIRPEMIHQHKTYFTVASLKQLLEACGFKDVRVSLFELGLNTLVIGNKP
jgi:ubiquinone/menaquinone biosynthesis C-methylase UbiE